MAKVAFSKLKCKINDEVKVIDFAGEKIEVKQYLPVQEKLGLIGRVISQAHEEDENYSNPIKILVFEHLEIMFAYTNISFTEKTREDLPKLYDTVLSSGLLNTVISAIPENEYQNLITGISNCVESIYKYQNSILGIMDILKNDYRALEEIDVEGMHDSLQELAESPIVKEIAPLLGLQ